MPATAHELIEGTVAAGFEPVRDAFVENFTQRNELGAACCVYRSGEKVVELWGGVRDRKSGAPWKPDTMAGKTVMCLTCGKAFALLPEPRNRCQLAERSSSHRPALPHTIS